MVSAAAGLAIEAGVDSIMVAHVTAPAIEPDPGRVATTSPAVVTGLLKGKLGFRGLVVTDALDMADQGGDPGRPAGECPVWTGRRGCGRHPRAR